MAGNKQPVAGKNQDAMKSFVEEHLLCLLRPTSEHVRDLQETVDGMKSELRFQGESLNKMFSKCYDHDQQLSTLGVELSQTGKKVNRMASEISSEIMETAKNLRSRMEDRCNKIEEQLQGANSLLESLQKSWKTSDTKIAELQRVASESKTDIIEMSCHLSHVDKSLEGWRHEQLGMSERLENHKRQIDDTTRNLQKLETNIAAKNAKFEENFRRHSKEIATLQVKFSKCKSDLEDHDLRLGSVADDLKKADKELGLIRGDLQEEKKTNEEQERSMRKLNVRQAIDVLYEKVEKTNKDVGKVLDELHEEEGVVARLGGTVDTAVENIAKHADDIVRLDKAQQSLGDQHKSAVKRLEKQEAQLPELKDRVDVAELDIKSLISFQSDANGKLDNHAFRLDKIDGRQDETDKRLDTTGMQIQSLKAELAANGETTAKSALSLDLAHEYLAGVGKGLEGAHKQLLNGHEDMLPYKKGPPRQLPSLPRAERALMDSTSR